MAKVKLPTPGVSSIGEDGSRSGVPVAPAPRRPLARGQDPIRNREGARQVDPRAIPSGTNRTQQDIIEIPIKRKLSSRTKATFTSVDGETYTFQTHDDRGKPLESRLVLSLYLAIREVELGGSASPVFDAFRLRIEDVDGKIVYPIPGQEPEKDQPKGAFSLGEGTGD